jgi:tartrate dehydratase beta subunit/fumarate hydratase class I family protein
MLPRICQPKKNREVVDMYSGSKLGMEAIRRTAVEDFRGLRIIGGKRNDFFKEFEFRVRARPRHCRA